MVFRSIAAAAALMGITVAHAQEPPRSRSAEELLKLTSQSGPQVINLREAPAAAEQEAPMPPDPPADAGAWSLHVHTTGGFTGQGVGSITISSDGQLACGPATCATPIARLQLDPVSRTLASIMDAAWIRRPPSSVCRDCIRTRVVLKRREGDEVRVLTASWDDSQPPGPEFRELRRLALEVHAARSPR